MMKLTLAVLSVVFMFNEAQAAPKTTPRAETVTTSSASTSSTKFGVGFSTYGGPANAASLSGMLQFGNVHSLQMLASIVSSSPFSFGVGGIYRANVIGDQSGGFHVGGGFTLGTVGAASTFYVTIPVLAGFQFGLGGNASNVQLSFDGGANFAVTPSPFQFSFTPVSAMGGASIHYYF